MNKTLRIHSKVSHSRANGPGLRAVVWFQGCSLGCPHCFNKKLNNPGEGTDIEINELFQWLVSLKGIADITLSGGEPTEQIPALLPFLELVRKETNLSILLFSGRYIGQILSLPGGERLISLLDVLIDGPYDHRQANPPGVWPSSANQKMHFLTGRYTMEDFTNLPCHEIIILEDGKIIKSGIFVYTEAVDYVLRKDAELYRSRVWLRHETQHF